MLITPRSDGIIPVSYLLHALDMRTVRNKVREYMTRNQDEIHAYEQCDWYQNTYKPARNRGEMFGFVYYVGRRPIGYGLITWRDDKFWLGGGIAPEAQGNGYGRELFEFLANFLKSGDVWLDVWGTNKKAIKLYRSLGFRTVFTEDGKLIMRKKVVAR